MSRAQARAKAKGKSKTTQVAKSKLVKALEGSDADAPPLTGDDASEATASGTSSKVRKALHELRMAESHSKWAPWPTCELLAL